MKVDADKARRAVFFARQHDEREARIWDRSEARAGVMALRRPLAAAKARPFVAPSPGKGKLLVGAPDQVATVSELGTLHRLGDNDGAAYALPAQTASAKFMARCEALLQTICRDETGQFETADETADRVAKDARLLSQGHAVCRALERAGGRGYRVDLWKLSSFDIHSHEVVEIPAFRRICLNPYVAHRLRLPFLGWLQYFAQGREKDLRFWTFTTGKRVPLHRLAARVTWLHRRISELNAQDWMKSAGVQIVFRSTEFGTMEAARGEAAQRKAGDWRDEPDAGALEGGSGGRWYHPHAHCVVHRAKKLGRVLWSGLLEKVWRFWHHNWDEGGQIEDMREVVKYVVKPGDVVRLAEENPGELLRLQATLFRKKLVQPMGELAAQMRAAARAGLRPLLRWVDGERQEWRLVADWNKNRLASGADRSGLYGSDGVKPDFRSALDDTLSPLPSEMSRGRAEKYFRLDRAGVNPKEKDVCRVVARCAPAFNSRGLKSPRVIVCGNFFDKSAVLAHPLVRRMIAATRAAYQQGEQFQAMERGALPLHGEVSEGSAFRVHTGTPTVGTEPAEMDAGPVDWWEPGAWEHSAPAAGVLS